MNKDDLHNPLAGYEAAKANIPQLIADWKKEIEGLLETDCQTIGKHKYVKLSTARLLMRECFEKGFKTARRNRNALGKYLIAEMEKRFVISQKNPPLALAVGDKFERADGAILEILFIRDGFIKGFGSEGINQFEDTREVFETMIHNGLLQRL